MEHIGIDVHKRTSQVCIRTESGELVERKLSTAREAFRKLLGERERARIVIECRHRRLRVPLPPIPPDPRDPPVVRGPQASVVHRAEGARRRRPSEGRRPGWSPAGAGEAWFSLS